MEIVFKTAKLKKICEDIKKANVEWGPQLARKVIRRLNDIKSAEYLKDLNHRPPTRSHTLHGERKGQYAVDLIHPYRLIFQPISGDGIILIDCDPSQITKVKILEVVDYHE